MDSEKMPKETEDTTPKTEAVVMPEVTPVEVAAPTEVPEIKKEELIHSEMTLKAKLCKHWKLLTLVLIVVVLFLILSLGRGMFVAAIVDGEPISRLSVIKELEKRSGGQALDTMVIKKIILKRALERGISISEEDVNKEIATLEERMSTQGSTLEAALSQQGLTLEQFREQIILQKALEKILEDRLVATDEDVAGYLEQTKAIAPTGMTEEEFKDKVKEQIKNQKFGTEVETWLTEEKEKANIQYFVDYALPTAGADTVPVSEESNTQ